MVLRSLIRLSGSQPGPAPNFWIPGMRRPERKGHKALELLWWANAVGGGICTAFVIRCLLVKDRGLTPHVHRAEYSEKDNVPSVLQNWAFKGMELPPQDLSQKPDIGVFQPLTEAGKVVNDH